MVGAQIADLRHFMVRSCYPVVHCDIVADEGEVMSDAILYAQNEINSREEF